MSLFEDQLGFCNPAAGPNLEFTPLYETDACF
jgi:hypothetical protein